MREELRQQKEDMRIQEDEIALALFNLKSEWNVVIGVSGPKSTFRWIIRIGAPNLMKLSQGLLVVFVSFVIIVQSDNIIDLLKDFTALMVLSETDNITFNLAVYEYLGEGLKQQTLKADEANSNFVQSQHAIVLHQRALNCI